MPTTLKTKVLDVIIALGVIIVFGALTFIIYNQNQLKNQQTAIQTQIVQQQQLVNGIVRSQEQWATKGDMAKFAQDNNINLKAIQDNLKTLGAQVSSINVSTSNSNGQVANNVPSSNTGPTNPNPPHPTTVPCPNGGTVDCPNTDPYGYQKMQQNLALNEDFGTMKLSFGSVGFSAWQQNPWDVNIQPREYNMDTVLGLDSNQRQYYYSKFSIKTGGKTYDIPIKNATTRQEYPQAMWSWFNPRLSMGINGGLNITHVQGEFTPDVSVSIMSYGQYLQNPDFSILGVGLGYGTVNKTAEVVITPVAYNIGKNLFSPLMNNTYVGPSFMINTDGSLGAGVGVRVGF